MTSTYYINYQIIRKNGTTAWLNSPEFETEADARVLYEVKMNKTNVCVVHLFRRDHYQPEEMRRPDYHPNGFDDYRLVATYSRI